MFKFAAPLFAAVCLVGFASTAQASSCTFGATLSCSLNEGDNSPNPEYGVILQSEFPDIDGDTVPGDAPGWFEAWTFMLEVGTNYTGPGDNGNVSDIVHIYATGAEMWSQGFNAIGGGNGAFGANFNAIIAFALGLGPAGTVQVVGEPSFPIARNFLNAAGGRIGLTNEDLTGLAHLVDIGGPGFTGDTLDVQSTPDQTAAVPEPATLTLMGIGGAVAALRRRRKTA